MTLNRVTRSAYPNTWPHSLISWNRNQMYILRTFYCRIDNNPMMARHYSWSYIYRPSHLVCYCRLTVGNNLVHYIRSNIFFRIFLSIFPQKPCTNPRIRVLLTPNRNWTIKPLFSTPIKHCSTSRIRGNYYMITPQLNRGGPEEIYPSPNPNSGPGDILYLPASRRILRSPVYYRWQGIRLYILCSNRIPRPSRNHWV